MPLRLLRERWAVTGPGAGASTAKDPLPRCLAALRFESSKSHGGTGFGGGAGGGGGGDASAPGGDEDEVGKRDSECLGAR